MNKTALSLILLISLVGCKKNDSPPTEVSTTAGQSYYHLSAGDLFIYHRTYWGPDTKDTFTVSRSIVAKGSTYYIMKNFPLGETTKGKDILLRSDTKGDIYTLYIANGDTVPDLLYKCSGAVGDVWTTTTLGSDITFKIESKSDTTSTILGNYSQCIRILIRYGYYAIEEQWLAPNVGFVKSDYEDFTGRPGAVKYSYSLADTVFHN